MKEINVTPLPLCWCTCVTVCTFRLVCLQLYLDVLLCTCVPLTVFLGNVLCFGAPAVEHSCNSSCITKQRGRFSYCPVLYMMNSTPSRMCDGFRGQGTQENRTAGERVDKKE